MNLDVLIGVLLTAAICGLLAFLAALLLRTRVSILGYIGAGLFGQGIGMWLAGAVHGGAWPYALTVSTASVHLLWTFVGALLVLLVFRYVPGQKR
jgi:uncharacterized membrane protein YeaQ/YmgE (transglycosylase-associated protein family)